MKFDLTSPCAGCPFQKTKPIPLRAGRVQEIAGPMLEFPGQLFECHTTNENRRRHGKQHCAGALIFALHNRRATLGMMLAERVGLFDPNNLKFRAPVFKSLAAMKAAHAAASNPPKKKRVSK